MRLTLLDYVQNILSALSGDEVNSISDTTESLQVKEIVKTCYFNIVTRSHLPEHKQFLQFLGSEDNTKPVLMYLPDGTTGVEWIKYFNNNANTFPPTTTQHGVNTDLVPTPTWTTTSTTSVSATTGEKIFTVASSTLAAQANQGVTCTSSPSGITLNGYVLSYSGTTLTIEVSSFSGSGSSSSWTISANPANNQAVPGYEDVTLMPVEDFVNLTSGFNPVDSNVSSYTFTDDSNGFPGTFTMYYKTDRQPMYCTVVSDYYVLFDSYDSTVDSTLQTNKCLAYGQVIPSWKDEDTFIPLLDDAQVPLLLNEAKSLAFLELKQTLHQKAEQEAKRQWSSLQRDKSRADKASDFDRLPNFGRWGRSSFAGLSFFKAAGWDRQ